MFAALIVAGLLPSMVGSGAGSELRRRIAARIVGGRITAPLVVAYQSRVAETGDMICASENIARVPDRPPGYYKDRLVTFSRHPKPWMSPVRPTPTALLGPTSGDNHAKARALRRKTPPLRERQQTQKPSPERPERGRFRHRGGIGIGERQFELIHADR